MFHHELGRRIGRIPCPPANVPFVNNTPDPIPNGDGSDRRPEYRIRKASFGENMGDIAPQVPTREASLTFLLAYLKETSRRIPYSERYADSVVPAFATLDPAEVEAVERIATVGDWRTLVVEVAAAHAEGRPVQATFTRYAADVIARQERVLRGREMVASAFLGKSVPRAQYGRRVARKLGQQKLSLMHWGGPLPQ